MGSTERIWRVTGVVSLLATVLFAGGFAYAVRSILAPQSAAGLKLAPPPQTALPEVNRGGDLAGKAKINIVALGDSLTAGTGDISGKGYVNRVKDKLTAQWSRPVYVLNNLAVPGYRTEQLQQQLETKATLDAVAQADVVLLTIGGNDINEGTSGTENGIPGDQVDFARAKANLPGASKRLDAIFTKLAQTNPNALIVYCALYYPYLDLDKERIGPPIIQSFNKAAFDAANKFTNILVVPTYDLFVLGGTKYLYTDHFHPNGDGYERIADRIAQALK